MKIPCPSCPDGNEWNIDGPTGRACRTCGGLAYIGDDEPELCWCGNEPDEEEQASNRCKSCGGKLA